MNQKQPQVIVEVSGQGELKVCLDPDHFQTRQDMIRCSDDLNAHLLQAIHFPRNERLSTEAAARRIGHIAAGFMRGTKKLRPTLEGKWTYGA